MIIFKSDKPNTLFSILKEWIIDLLLVSLIISIYYIFISKNINKIGYYFIWVSVMVFSLLLNIITVRLYELQIDEDERQIIFLSKSLLSKTSKILLSIDNGRLEIDRNKSRWLKIGAPLTLCFLKNKMEVIKITKRKDGYSIETLNKICKTIEELSLQNENA